MSKEIIKNKTKLSERADEAILQDEASISTTIEDIKDILYNSDLVALAAPQIGVNQRLFCIKFSDGDIRTFINPLITKRRGIHLSLETNASIDGEYLLPRYDEIEVAYQTPTGKLDENLFKGCPGEVFQQMVDMLEGVLISDYGLEIIPEWYEATDEERSQVIQAYINDLKLSEEKFNQDVKNDPELSKLNDAIDFMTSVQTGKTKLEIPQSKLPNRATRRAQAKFEKKLKKVKK